ncbi:trifunctional histidinol dehydrogenase [Chytridiales sp. JEL 0842]|nr:trifunctional histidinol dehydrogenase [Chytridiales sp. JEL 0842]
MIVTAVACKDVAALNSAVPIIGDVLVTDYTPATAPTTQLQDLQDSTGVWIQLATASPVDLHEWASSAIAALDNGATKVVLPLAMGGRQPAAGEYAFENSAAAAAVDQILAVLPHDRLIFKLNVKDLAVDTSKCVDLIRNLNRASSGYIVTVNSNIADADLPSFAKQLVSAASSAGIYRRLVLDIQLKASSIALNLIKQLSEVDADVLIPQSSLSTATESEQGISIGKAFSACLVTDRSDGLFPTVVVDEQRVALGLAYSSVESICETLRTGTGVYQSRTRGLWYKGLTSGATQAIKKIQVDCDRDTIQFVVVQKDPGYCHMNTRTCFGKDFGLGALDRVLQSRKVSAPQGSYTRRLFEDSALLNAKIIEEANELCEAKTPEEIAWEAADLIYFALSKCASAGVSLTGIERNLERKAKKVSRRPGNAKAEYVKKDTPAAAAPAPKPETTAEEDLKMKYYTSTDLSADQYKSLLQRPIINSAEIMSRVQPIVQDVQKRGDAALIDLTKKFDGVHLSHTVIKAPFPAELMQIEPRVKQAIDVAYENILKFHASQLDKSVSSIETMPGVVCSRFVRPIDRVGLYVPGGTAVLPSTTLMLGIPAQVAGCSEIVIASPPRKDGTPVPEVVYVASKVGASTIILAGGAQAVAAMAYGTESVPKVDKIAGPGNQYVTAAKMLLQNDSRAMISIDMPAGPSELLVIADSTCNPAYVASDLLSQAEHGADSQVVLVAIDLNSTQLAAIQSEITSQALALPRVEIVRKSIPHSFVFGVKSLKEAMEFSNEYAPEHLILHIDNAEKAVEMVQNAGSVFVGQWSPESCGDYASGTNHTLPTYGYARMYSGVNTGTFVKHITSQMLTKEGLNKLGDTVTTLAEIEGLEAHRNAVAIRLKDIRGQ